MRRALLLFAVVGLSLAGCVATKDDETPATTSPEVMIDADRPEPAFNDIPNADLGTLAPPDAAATLAEAPILKAGEWWRIELHDLITDNTTQFVRVVARAEDDVYVMGMPHEGWWKEAVIFHTPAFGDVNKDLSHRAHDVPFQELKFPLEDGATWETAWENPAPITASVKVESPTTARVTFTGQNCGLAGLVGQCPNPTEGVVAEVVYDATLHEVSEASFPSHTWKVLEHGYGYEGWVTVPRAEHLVFFHGRLGASVVDFATTSPTTPTDTVQVEGGFNRVSFILAVGNAVGTPVGGAYSEKATAPDGTVYQLDSIPGGPFTVGFYEGRDPDGEWQLEHTAVGPGIAFIEGIAYHQYDIRLPDGAIRSDHSHEVVR
ncbi:MAG TPA: hypothetical protein VM370_04275 [Candidatus Thermoplasmatota archaeon]|nr:hypothetical protein [Candidatus Thermoplasmatota archaeon]